MATKITVLTINGVTYSITAADPPDQADFPAWSRTIAHEIADVLQAAPALGTGALADVTKNTAAIAKLEATHDDNKSHRYEYTLTIPAGTYIKGWSFSFENMKDENGVLIGYEPHVAGYIEAGSGGWAALRATQWKTGLNSCEMYIDTTVTNGLTLGQTKDYKLTLIATKSPKGTTDAPVRNPNYDGGATVTPGWTNP